MESHDLQCGDLWTHPAERGRGFGRLGLSVALFHAWRPGRRVWYLTQATNEASARLARGMGFELVGQGRRTSRVGMKVLGQFVMTIEQ